MSSEILIQNSVLGPGVSLGQSFPKCKSTFLNPCGAKERTKSVGIKNEADKGKRERDLSCLRAFMTSVLLLP